MTRTIVFIVIIVVISPARLAFSNGGPVAWTGITPRGGFLAEKSQNVKSNAHPDKVGVRLIEESLNISINDDLNTYDVRAVYELETGSNDRLVLFAVPLTWNNEELFSRNNYEVKDLSEINEMMSEKAKGISIKLDGEAYKCTIIYEHDLFSELGVDADTTINDLEFFKLEYDKNVTEDHLANRICITEDMLFKKESRSILELEYTAEMLYTDMIFSKSPLTRFQPRVLSYLLHPAGNWDGTAERLKIKVDLGSYTGFVEQVSLPDGKEEDSTIKWDLTDVDLANLSPLEITLDKTPLEKKELLEWNNRTWEFERMPLSVLSSSQLEGRGNISYGPNNVLDARGDTAWCEGAKGNGEGEWLEFRAEREPFFKYEYCTVHGISIAPGYLKSQKVFSKNGRVKKIRLDSCDGSLTKTFNLESSDDYRLSPQLLELRLYQEPKELPCFRLIIVEVNEGKVPDTCISEVALVINCG